MNHALPPAFQAVCEKMLGTDILSAQPLSGGDINQARLLHTPRGPFFLKMNTGQQAPRMFATEAQGLQLLAAAGAVRTPRVIGTVVAADQAGLLLEYLTPSYREEGFWEKFGVALAALHRQSAPQFGLDHDNFIGSLPQPNGRHDTWPDFYRQERLQPQLDLAKSDNKLTTSDLDNAEKLLQKLPDLCPTEPPALTHGDLWSGNFLVGPGSQPVLIDPAASFAHREMDLAMSRLFGGFARPFYRAYEEAWPLAPGFEQRLEIYQLYYLLVHVNLFGGSYIGSVRNILRRFVG